MEGQIHGGWVDLLVVRGGEVERWRGGVGLGGAGVQMVGQGNGGWS